MCLYMGKIDMGNTGILSIDGRGQKTCNTNRQDDTDLLNSTLAT